MAHFYGVNGAALAGVVSNVFGLIALWIFQRQAHRSIEAERAADHPEDDAGGDDDAGDDATVALTAAANGYGAVVDVAADALDDPLTSSPVRLPSPRSPNPASPVRRELKLDVTNQSGRRAQPGAPARRGDRTDYSHPTRRLG